MVSQMVSMASVAGKQPSLRRAIAAGAITLGSAFDAVVNGTLTKGNALQIAEIAAIQGAKKTPDLLPLCHPLGLNRVWLRWAHDDTKGIVTAYSMAEVFAKTGVEMEALAAVSSALLCVWDLAKPVEPDLAIDGVRLLYKSGGKKGVWQPNPLPITAQELLHDAEVSYQ